MSYLLRGRLISRPFFTLTKSFRKTFVHSLKVSKSCCSYSLIICKVEADALPALVLFSDFYSTFSFDKSLLTISFCQNTYFLSCSLYGLFDKCINTAFC